MVKSWIVGLPGYESQYFVHVRGSTVATKASYSFSLSRYPKVKDPKTPFPKDSVLHLGFSDLGDHCLCYSFRGFVSSFNFEVASTPMIEQMRSLLEHYKSYSNDEDIFTSNIFVLTKAFMDETVCTFPMLEAMLAFASSFFSKKVASFFVLGKDQVFLYVQAMFLLYSAMPECMVDMLLTNPLRYWKVSGEALNDLQDATKHLRIDKSKALSIFRVESLISYKDRFSIKVETLSLDEIKASHRVIMFQS